MAERIVSIVLSDGTVLDASALKYISFSKSGNLEIATDGTAKINIEPADNLAIKPGGKIQIDTNHKPEGKKDEMEVSVICDKKSKVEGLKMNVAGLKFVTEGADTNNGWDPSLFKMFFKNTSGSDDTFTKVNMHAASFDIRTRSTGPGTGGGIALQIASTDSKGHENKIKFESDRTNKIGSQTPTYNGEGGKGLEFGTFNNEHASLYCGDYRFKADAPVFPATRRDLTQDPTTLKIDYPTNTEDDFKDFIEEKYKEDPVTWQDIIDAVMYVRENLLYQ